MVFKVILKLTILIAAIAMLLQMDMFSQTRETIMVFVHQKLGSTLQTCPYHAVQNILASIGLSNLLTPRSPRSDSTADLQSVIRYDDDKMFTKEELAKYTGSADSLGLYLGILGRVYDVSEGEKYYAPGNGYAFFAGRDGTKAFMTGDFTDAGLIDEVEGLSTGQMLELHNWIAFYEKTYSYVGKVAGNFYDASGRPTPALLEAQRLVEVAQAEKQALEEHRRNFPPCNSAWSKEAGSWVSCSDKSGGVHRSWAGLPRQYHTPGKDRADCVCVRTSGPPSDDPTSEANRGDLDNPHVKLYDGCEPDAEACRIA